MNTVTAINAVLTNALSDPALKKSICRFLDWAPEIKHEGLVSTHISAFLSENGTKARREQSMSRRRIDILVEGQSIEAKYHFEGDLLEIEQALSAGAVHNASGWNSATNAVLGELARGKASYFMWHVCVRSLGMDARYKYPELINKFFTHTQATTHLQAAANAATIIDTKLFPLFQARVPGLVFWQLPNIAASHTTLLSRLYCFPARHDA
jgi:hypothetical protein